MTQIANLFEYYQKEEKKKKKTFSEHLNKNQLIYHFKTKLGQNKIVANMRVCLIFKIHQCETNAFYMKNLKNFCILYIDFYIKNLKNFCIQYWNRFRRETGFAGKLDSQENWFYRETCFFFFFLSLLKFSSLYLWWNKLLIMKKLQFCDFLRN